MCKSYFYPIFDGRVLNSEDLLLLDLYVCILLPLTVIVMKHRLPLGCTIFTAIFFNVSFIGSARV